MKLFLSALALCLPLSGAFAEGPSVFEYTYFGNRVVVSCDYAERVVEEFMDKFGAKDMSIVCRGGIDSTGISPLELRVEYQAPVITAESKTEKMKLYSDPFESNCNFDTQLMRSLLPKFPNVKMLSSSTFCAWPDSRYRYEFLVTL